MEPQTQAEYDQMMAESQQQEQAKAPSPNEEMGLDIRQERISNVLDQLDPHQLLLDVEKKLRALKYNYQTGKWEPIDKNKKPVSDLLVSNMISNLSTFLTKNVTMTNLSATQINNIMDDLINEVAVDLDVNDEKYEILENYPEMTRIGNIICRNVFFVLLRAQNGMESRRIFHSLTLKGDVDPNPQSSKKGIWDALKFWG